MYFARNSGVREALAARHVTIVGCGSFGSAMADMLVRAGLGSLTLIDPECLAAENIGRHILTTADIGKPKAAALAARLREVNPELAVEAREEKFQDGEGLLASCADSRRCESLVNAVSLRRGLRAMYIGAYGAVRAAEAQFCVPGRTPCRECFASFRSVDAPAPSRQKYSDPDWDETRTPGQSGLWGSVLAVTGIAFQGLLALLGAGGRLDLDHPLWLVNLDYGGLQPFAVTFCRVARGCAVCDEARVADLSAGDDHP